MQSPVVALGAAIGVDVDSKRLQITTASATTLNTPVIAIANNAAAIKAWLKTLAPGCRIGMEATGKYHRTLAELAVRAGHTVFVFNPAQIASYLRCQRSRGKTDVLDARGIARYVLNESAGCHPYVPPGPLHATLAMLIQRRHQVVKQRSSLTMSLEDLPHCTVQIGAVKDALAQLLAAIDDQINATFASEQPLQCKRQLLCSIHGFGPLVSAAVAARLSRAPYANSDAVVAAFGMDPRPRDSGESVGRRYLSKRGNAEERRLIYLAAVSACHNALFKAMRDRLLLRGMSAIQAYCVIARKLLRIAFAVWTSGQPFNPSRLGKG